MSETGTTITERVKRTLAALPENVDLVAAAKTRSPNEVRAALAGGIRFIAQNYVQEAEAAVAAVGRTAAQWHMIGHLQRNKVKAAVVLFDMIQTVDSLRLAEKISAEAVKVERTMPILIEINSALEPQKSGVLPDDAIDLVRAVAELPALRIEGLMTMGPLTADPEDVRPLFRRTKKLFDQLADLAIPNVAMKTLSMGMSSSYAVAIEEGSTMIRIGTALFGPRTS